MIIFTADYTLGPRTFRIFYPDLRFSRIQFSLTLDFCRNFPRTSNNDDRSGSENESDPGPSSPKPNNKRKASGGPQKGVKKRKKHQVPQRKLVAPAPLNEGMDEDERLAAWKARWSAPPSKVCSVFPSLFHSLLPASTLRIFSA
jgi:hypothetical protein